MEAGRTGKLPRLTRALPTYESARLPPKPGAFSRRGRMRRTEKAMDRDTTLAVHAKATDRKPGP